MAFKVTMAFGMDGTGRLGYGWSESHIYLGAASTIEQVKLEAKEIALPRLDLCAGNTFLKEVRISRLGRFRASDRLLSDIEPERAAEIRSRTSKFADFSSDIPDSSLLVEMTTADEVVKGRTYMAGLPDPLIRTDEAGPDYKSVPGWKNAFKAYRLALTHTGKWGMRARVPAEAPFPVPIRNWDLEVGGSGRLRFAIPKDLGLGDIGTRVHVRNVTTHHHLTARPVGLWSIAAIENQGQVDWYTLRHSEGYTPSTFKDLGTVEPVIYANYAYTDMKIIGQVGHKRGVGSIRPRGRSSRRPRRLV